MTTSSLETLVLEARHRLFARPESHSAAGDQVVVVAVSGGVDSVCLLDLLHRLAPAWGLALHVAHLNHALRRDAAADADFVAALAAAYGLPFHGKRLQPGALAAYGGSLEAAARHARYTFLAQVARTVTPAGQTPTVALAHHANDQAETVLHHLVRGSGLDGLAGMRQVTDEMVGQFAEPSGEALTPLRTAADGVRVRLIRPLLAAPRALILQYVQDQQLAWREDCTNTDQRLTRNYLRHTVLPALLRVNPQVVAALSRTAALVAEEGERLAAYDRALLASLQWPSELKTALPLAEMVLDLAQWQSITPPTQRALLRLALQRIAASPLELTFAQLDRLCEALRHATAGGPHPILSDLAWSVAAATAEQPTLLSLHRLDRIPFSAKLPLLPAGVSIPLAVHSASEGIQIALQNGWQVQVTSGDRTLLPANWQAAGLRWRAFFDADRMQRAVLTTPTPGQRFAPLGLGGHHKLLGDLFTDQKIPVAQRAHWPLLVDEATGIVHWVCGLRPGHVAQITAATTHVLGVTLTSA